MLHCPYCGMGVKEDEKYCMKCGKNLPKDMHSRFHEKKQFNKFWYLPILIFGLLLLFSGIYYVILQNQSTQAKELYQQGEQRILERDYEKARDLFADATDYKNNFNQAEISLHFMDSALKVEATLEDASELLADQDFQQALSLVNEAESNLDNFKGTAVNLLIDTINSKRNTIKTEQLKNVLEEDPSIDNLKILLWEADAIDNEEAEAIRSDIRDRIIDYTFSKASEQLNNTQFNDAQILVEDGLKYAPDSERLQSLQTTIDKEQTAFETAQQQRIEQAMNTAAKEQERNENDAIELVSATIETDDQENLIVKGEVESVATIPINSVLIEYSLLARNGDEIFSNEVYVNPDKLYPEESGQFEFTHFDIDEQSSNVDVEVRKITWYTN